MSVQTTEIQHLNVIVTALVSDCWQIIVTRSTCDGSHMMIVAWWALYITNALGGMISDSDDVPVETR